MITTDRRSFIKALVASAVAVSLPNIPIARARTLTEKITDAFDITVNGKPPIDIEITDAGDGWSYVTATFEDVLIEPLDPNDYPVDWVKTDDPNYVPSMEELEPIQCKLAFGKGCGEEGLAVIDRDNIELLEKHARNHPDDLLCAEATIPYNKPTFSGIFKLASDINT